MSTAFDPKEDPQSLTDAVKERLIEEAELAASKAYAPYSGFRVGSAVLDRVGNISIGCNVENASYGLTICAERSAIFNSIAHSADEDFEIRAIAVVEAGGSSAPPCGACLQVIMEHGPDATVIFRNDGAIVAIDVRHLLPYAFSLNKALDGRT